MHLKVIDLNISKKKSAIVSNNNISHYFPYQKETTLK